VDPLRFTIITTPTGLFFFFARGFAEHWRGADLHLCQPFQREEVKREVKRARLRAFCEPRLLFFF
jgi:hypothetical protein